MKRITILCLLFFYVFNLSAQELHVKVELADKNSFTIPIIPDPQSYIKYDLNQPIFDLMTAWIAHHIEPLNMKTLLCTGDLVEQNLWPIPNQTNGNQTGEQQWKAISRSFECLDNKLPYILCTGNHDYGYERAENRMSRFPDYFPVERNLSWKNTLVAVAKNAFGIPSLENAAFEFTTDTWGKLLIISIEFDPRPEMIEWAKEITTSDKYKDHKVIILTHSYMGRDASLIEKEDYLVSPALYGKDIWEQLLYPSDNIVLLVCGHACAIDTYEGNVSFRTDKNAKGREISQMMFNAQTGDGKWSGNGGDGWIRLLEFMPDGKTIQVRTFSPLIGTISVAADKAWRTDSYDQFSFTIK
ncbi:metallophosphoesterase [Parabacteroides sp. OttesenSCG-928-G07]|nr:metallophosphoesterase [Parabacteroides sp. OttesenSCG-928-G07]